MNPLELKDKYQWSYQKLSILFGVSELSVRRWGFQGKAHRSPNRSIQILAGLIDKHPELIEVVTEISLSLEG